MAQFSEQVEVVGVNVINPGPDASQIMVTLRQSNGSQFSVIDAITNVSEYPIGTQIPHTVGS